MKKKKKKIKKMNKSVHIDNNGAKPVPPVPPVPAPPDWPPPWLAGFLPEGPICPPSQQVRGWKLASGPVICATCHPPPCGSTAVVLEDTAEGPTWVEDQPEDPSEANQGVSGCGADVSANNPSAVSSDCSAGSVDEPQPQRISLGEGWL